LQFNEVVKLRHNKAGLDFGADSEMGGATEYAGFKITSNNKGIAYQGLKQEGSANGGAGA
jgi:hypothetical protein